MTDYTELKRLAEIMVRDVNGDLSDAEARNFHQHLSDYEAATTPEKILALIAENDEYKAVAEQPESLNASPAAEYEGLKRQFFALRNYALCKDKLSGYYSRELERLRGVDRSQSAGEIDAERDINEQLTNDLLAVEAERDQLKAENERLKTLRSTTERDLAQELEVWRHGPSCWNCGDTGDVHDMVGEWLGQCDCNAAKLIDISSEREQLRAEIAGLKTGYEAYERVNAELKAECARSTEREILQLAEIEALRDDIEQSQYDANAWRDGEESVWIEVFHSEGDDPFISAISGQITVEQLALIQAEILEYRDDYFEKGSGLYVFRCGHCQAHYDNVGMTEPAHWETDFESYSPFPWEEEAALGQGEQS